MTARLRTNKNWQMRVYVVFSILGAILIATSFLIGLLLLGPTAGAYFGSNAKGSRDAAEAGSALLAQLRLLQATPRWLEPLTILGVASFMLGIALEFSTIPSILEARGRGMRRAFPIIARLGGRRSEVPPETKAPIPFRMIESMMPAYPVIAAVGWALVVIALLIGATDLAQSRASFFSEAKAVREAAAAGSALLTANVSSHVLETWVPQFKFFGLGLGLMAITMALGTIAKRLRRMGHVISAHTPEALRPQVPPIPRSVRVFQLSTVMGIMILAAALIIGVALAAGLVPDYWGHSIAEELNPAQPGSEFLAQLAEIRSFPQWLDPLRMVGMAFLFTGITIALSLIINTLEIQNGFLARLHDQSEGGSHEAQGG